MTQHDIRNKKVALAHVASHVAAHVQACTFEEATGLPEGELTGAEGLRLEWALEELIRRLYALCKDTDQEGASR